VLVAWLFYHFLMAEKRLYSLCMNNNVGYGSRKSRKGGFTVYELTLVILIVALLIAFLLPRVVGNIRFAKESAEIADTQTVTVTLQALLVMTYGRELTDDDGQVLRIEDLIYFDAHDPRNVKLTAEAYRAMEELTGLKFGTVEYIVLENISTLRQFRYTTPHGSIVDYNHGNYFVIELY